MPTRCQNTELNNSCKQGWTGTDSPTMHASTACMDAHKCSASQQVLIDCACRAGTALRPTLPKLRTKNHTIQGGKHSEQRAPAKQNYKASLQQSSVSSEAFITHGPKCTKQAKSIHSRANNALLSCSLQQRQHRRIHRTKVNLACSVISKSAAQKRECTAARLNPHMPANWLMLSHACIVRHQNAC
jgi:hypothetical protein